MTGGLNFLRRVAAWVSRALLAGPEPTVMNQPEAQTARRCHDCGLVSPQTKTSYTLIGAAHGWRLVRRIDQYGEIVLEWRCPTCWEQHKHSTK